MILWWVCHCRLEVRTDHPGVRLVGLECHRREAQRPLPDSAVPMLGFSTSFCLLMRNLDTGQTRRVVELFCVSVRCALVRIYRNEKEWICSLKLSKRHRVDQFMTTVVLP